MCTRVARTTKPTNPSQGATRQGKAPCVVLGLFSGIGIFGLGEWTWAVMGCSWMWGWSAPRCVWVGLGPATHRLDLAGGRALFLRRLGFCCFGPGRGPDPLDPGAGGGPPPDPLGRGPSRAPPPTRWIWPTASPCFWKLCFTASHLADGQTALFLALGAARPQLEIDHNSISIASSITIICSRTSNPRERVNQPGGPLFFR